MVGRPLLLSRSIRQGDRTAPGRCIGRYIDGSASCVIGAAFLGQLYGPADVAKFMGFAASASREGLCDFVLHGVMKAFPVLGEGVDRHPKLEPLVARQHLRGLSRLFAPIARDTYRSLFGVLTALHDQHAWSKAQLAGALERAGL